MPIYDETWDSSDYLHRQKVNLKTLPPNHINKLSSLQFDFVEYKTHQLIACHLYERMTIHCYNQYGMLQQFYKHPECLDAKYYFEHCVRLNAGYGIQKKYFPEFFVTNSYSRPVPHFNEIITK